MRPLIHILKISKKKLKKKKRTKIYFRLKEEEGEIIYDKLYIHIIIQDSEIAVVSSWSPIKNVE